MERLALILLLVVGGITGCAEEKKAPPVKPALPPFEAGQAEARAELSDGRMGWRVVGQPMPHDALYAHILKHDYGVSLVLLGCGPTKAERQKAAGYNAVMREAINSEFGEDALERAEIEARRRWQQQRPVIQ